MSSYHYHLKLELYPSEDPEASLVAGGAASDSIWHPSDGANIFEDLPAHARRPDATAVATAAAKDQAQHTEDVENYIPVEHRRHAFSHQQNAQALSQEPDHPIQQQHRQQTRVIDCGATRPAAPPGENSRNIVVLSERQYRARSSSIPPPGFTAGLGPKKASRDWRFGRISIESFDLAASGKAANTELEDNKHGNTMASGGRDGHNAAAASTVGVGTTNVTPAASLGPSLGGAGQTTRARYTPLETKNTEIGWGIVHLYREGAAGGSGEVDDRLRAGGEKPKNKTQDAAAERASDGDDGTILCIPAVPSYLSPSDFLGFVGEQWRGDVSHYRMVVTSRMSRYMVLMKFRDHRRAREWRKEFDGKVFNSMEAEICHVTFIKSITVETPAKQRSQDQQLLQESSSSLSTSLKPFPPPTADLVELPTCPVCLERMDDTAGLMTILCQHVFHCTCLQTWKGSGCPVCRATNPSSFGPASSGAAGAAGQVTSASSSDPFSTPFGAGVSNLCSVCDCASDLWICLICGNVGCGRYKGGHAKEHWKETAHSFSLELETQHVWDYAGDMWVHRLIREKGDGKVFELPGSGGARPNGGNDDRRGRRYNNGEEDEYVEDDVVPRAKLDRIGIEYTHLLTSQLESQRVYFEELVSKAADKASKASAAAEAASLEAAEATRQLKELRASHARLQQEVVPFLERDVERERRRADKASELARSMSKSLQEEKRLGEGLMARIEHVNRELEDVRAEIEKLKLEGEELRETNRDLTMFISGQEKVKELENEGKIQPGELEGGTVSVPQDKKKGKGKGRGKK